MRASRVLIVLLALAGCQGAPPDDAATRPEAPSSALMTPAVPRSAPTRRERPTELRAAAELVGAFPVPEGARFQRRAGRVGVYRLAAPLAQVVRFYRQAGFTVLDKPRGATVYPQVRTREQELLVVRHLFGDVVQLIVYQGRGGDAP